MNTYSSPLLANQPPPKTDLPPLGRLEPEYQPAYLDYRDDPNPANASRMLSVMQPVLQRGVQAYAGAKPSPLLNSHAKRIALQAIRNYDPNQAKLSTHILNHLQGLRRISQKQRQVIPLPEQVRLSQTYLLGREREFEDEHGREPTLEELADYASLSAKRIEYLRKFPTAIASGSMQSSVDAASGEASGYSPAVQSDKASQAWVQAVYGDLNPINRLVMEYALGMGGKPALQNQQIAAKLKLSPGAVSQRKKYIQALLDQEASISPFL